MATKAESGVDVAGAGVAIIVFTLALLEPIGCRYDYRQLDPGATGGATTVGGGGVTAPDGSGGSGGFDMASETGGTFAAGGAQSGEGGRSGSPGLGGQGGRPGSASGGNSGSSGQPGPATGGGTGTGGFTASGGRPGAGGSATGGSGSGASGPGGTAGTGGRDAVPTILSVDFVGGTPSSSGSGAPVTPATPLTRLEVAGLKPAANWNNAFGNMGTLAQLVLADGTTSAASITWSSPGTANTSGVWSNNYTDTDANTKMMQGYLDPVAPDMPATVTLANLPAGLTRRGYDLYLYFTADLSRVETFTFRYAVGSTTHTAIQVGPTATTFPGFQLAPDDGSGNTIVFPGLTDAGFTLVATAGAGPRTRAPINGIQLVALPGN